VQLTKEIDGVNRKRRGQSQGKRFGCVDLSLAAPGGLAEIWDRKGKPLVNEEGKSFKKESAKEKLNSKIAGGREIRAESYCPGLQFGEGDAIRRKEPPCSEAHEECRRSEHLLTRERSG